MDSQISSKYACHKFHFISKCTANHPIFGSDFVQKPARPPLPAVPRKLSSSNSEVPGRVLRTGNIWEIPGKHGESWWNAMNFMEFPSFFPSVLMVGKDFGRFWKWKSNVVVPSGWKHHRKQQPQWAWWIGLRDAAESKCHLRKGKSTWLDRACSWHQFAVNFPRCWSRMALIFFAFQIVCVMKNICWESCWIKMW